MPRFVDEPACDCFHVIFRRVDLQFFFRIVSFFCISDRTRVHLSDNCTIDRAKIVSWGVRINKLLDFYISSSNFRVTFILCCLNRTTLSLTRFIYEACSALFELSQNCKWLSFISGISILCDDSCTPYTLLYCLRIRVFFLFVYG